VAAKKSKATKKDAQEALSKALAKAVKAKTFSATTVNQATTMVVAVEVDSNHLVPYSVRWDGDRILDTLQSDQAIVTLAPGNHVLTWSFNHSLETTWRHTLTVQVEGKAKRVLAEKSSTANPNDAVSGGTEIFVA
jgi:hypothetical protein